MIGFGWFFSLVGAILSGIGIYNENSATNADYGLGTYTRRGDIEDAETCLTIGLIVLAVGVILLVAGYIRRSIEYRHYMDGRYMERAIERAVGKNGNTPLLNTKRCTNCGYVGKQDDEFCQSCGKKFEKPSNEQ